MSYGSLLRDGFGRRESWPAKYSMAPSLLTSRSNRPRILNW